MFRKVLGLALLLAPVPAAAQPPVWVAHDADSRVVMFGSVHLLPPGLDWSPPALDEALKDADDLWFELPVDAAASSESARLAIQKGLLPPGESLSAALSPEGRERLARMTQALGLAPGVIEGMRPWLAEVTLTIAKVAQEGATGTAGVEHNVAAAAPASAERRALETAAEQVAFFADAPMEEQAASLETSLRQMEEEPGAFKTLVEAWMAGDLKGLEEQGLDPLREASPALYERLIVARNTRWAKAIARRMEGSGRTVVVVGAGHLIGPDGLPTLLRARGIAVEGPDSD